MPKPPADQSSSGTNGIDRDSGDLSVLRRSCWLPAGPSTKEPGRKPILLQPPVGTTTVVRDGNDDYEEQDQVDDSNDDRCDG